MNSQGGSILGLSVDDLLGLTNVAYLVSVAAALFFSVALWRLSTISGANKDLALKEYQASAQKEVTAAQALGSQAQAESSKANARVAALEKETALSKERSLQLEAQIEAERSGRMELRQDVSRLKPRDISPAQQTKLLDAFNLLGRGDTVIDLTYDLACSDCHQVSTVLNDVLNRVAGWKCIIGMIGGPPNIYRSHTGVKIMSNDRQFASALSEALEAGGIASETGPEPASDSNMQVTAHIFITNQVR